VIAQARFSCNCGRWAARLWSWTSTLRTPRLFQAKEGMHPDTQRLIFDSKQLSFHQ
jgi:hypothetical protein